MDLRWNINPVQATADGLSAHDHRYGVFTPTDVRAHVAALKSIASALEESEPDDLQDEVDRTALLGEIRVRINEFVIERPHVRNPQFWLDHVLEGLCLLLTCTDRSDEHRSSAAASRLSELPSVLRDAEETLEDCPLAFVETARQMAEGGEELLSQVGRKLCPQDDEKFAESLAAAQEALAGFALFLETELLENATADFAIGEEAFDFRLHYQHALRSTAPELWRYGLSLVEEVEHEIAEISQQLSAATDWHELVAKLRSDHPDPAGLVDAYASEMRRAQEFVLEHGIAPIPDGALNVIETPTFLRPLIPYAAYQSPGAYSPDRTGLFYVTTPDVEGSSEDSYGLMRDHCYYGLPTTALHEGYPGHHLQILTAQDQQRDVRRIISSPVAVEGWALYCEDMMGEEGFYRSLEEKLFQKVHLLWRAVRVMLDVGLHTRGMTFEEAVDLLVDKAYLERPNAEAEVRRYCAYPAYQICYAVGRREFRSLREAFMRASGSDYSLNAFHSAVLEYGGLPVSLSRWGMELDE